MIDAETLIARHHILNTLALHSRGIDRADAALLGGAYHSDATVDYGFFAGDAASFVPMLAGAMKAAHPTLHRTSNSWIKVKRDKAVSESYVIAYAEEAELQRFVLGRYLDRHALHGGEWRLTHRQYIIEGNMNRATTVVRGNPSPGMEHYVPEGAKGASDPGRAMLAHHVASARTTTMNAPAPSTGIDAALSRAEIHDLVMAYCRGVDRADEALLASIFTEDSTVISGVVNGSGAQFATGICAFVRNQLDLCFHSVANEWIEVSGDEAVGEHYALAHMVKDGFDVMTGGRYIDRYVRRGARWLIQSRSFVTDWNTSHPSSLERGGFYEALTSWGQFGRGDPVYALWDSLDG